MLAEEIVLRRDDRARQMRADLFEWTVAIVHGLAFDEADEHQWCHGRGQVAIGRQNDQRQHDQNGTEPEEQSANQSTAPTR